MHHKRKPSLRVGNRRKGRELCVQALYQYDLNFKDTASLKSLDWLAGKRVPTEKAVSYFHYLFEGTVKDLKKIDETVQQFLVKYDYNKVMPIDKAILRFAIFSLFNEKEMPCAIIINEAIEIAKTYSGKDGHKFINGVLDGVRKQLIEEGERLD